MAFEQDHIGAENLGVAAAENITAYKGLAVNVVGTGVLRSVGITSSAVYVLMNAPASGQAVSAWGPPNQAEAKAGLAVVLGDYITVSASAYFIPGSFSNAIGTARTAVASGGTFALRLL